MGKLTRVTIAAAGAAGALSLLHAARALGARVPDRSLAVAALISMAFASAAALRDIASVWRGPVVFSFRPGEAVICAAEQAEVVRAAAQLRGTMGGAGHVFPARLAVPAVAWGVIAGQSAALLESRDRIPEPSIFAVLVLAALLTLAFPAISFCYREVTGGRVLVYPPLACRRIFEAASARRAAVPVAVSPPAAGPGLSTASSVGGPQASVTPAPLEPQPDDVPRDAARADP